VSLSFAALFSLGSIAAMAQDAAPVTRAEFSKALADLKQEIQSLKAPSPPLSAAAPAATPEVPASRGATSPSAGTAATKGAEPAIVEAPTATMHKSSSGDDSSSMAARLDALEKRIQSLEDLQAAQGGFNSQVASYIRGPAYVGAIGSRLSPTAPVNPPTTGELQIRNQMRTVQQVVVNGTDLYTVAPGSTRAVKVGVGSITTQIRGEKPLTWFIGAPNYTQEIIIAPAALNPLETTLTSWYDPLSGSWVAVER